MKNTLILLAIISLLGSCSIVKKIAGADIDPVQFQKAREAKMLEVRTKSAAKLLERLNGSESIENADLIIFLDELFITSLSKQYEGRGGWLDKSTKYIVKSVNIKLFNGSANAALSIFAWNDDYNISVDLNLDCIMSVDEENGKLFVRLEPYNIYPSVNAAGVLAAAGEIIENLVKINLADIGKNFRDMSIPLDFKNSMLIPGKVNKVKDKINLTAANSERKLDYTLKIKEILFFEGKIMVALNLNNIEAN